MLVDQKELELLEKKLKEAIVQNDLKTLQKITHPDFIYTDEFGTKYKCLAELQAKSSHVIFLESISVTKREVSYFDNVAIINCHEIRTGTLHGEPFHATYFVSRVWKKNKNWCLLSVTLVKL